MATQAVYVGDGSTRDFDITFPYAGLAELRVSVDGADASFSLLNPSRVRLATAPATGSRVRVYRYTDITNPDVVFQDTAVLTERDLNNANEQLLFRLQEMAGDFQRLFDQAVQVPEGDVAPALPNAAFRAGKLLGFNSTGGFLTLAPSDFLGPKGDPGGNVMAIGTLSSASAMVIPAGTDLVQTSGYSVRGRGFARYAYDPAIDAAYVAANPRTSFLSSNGRGYRLAEPIVNIHQFGAVGDGVADDSVPFQAAVDYLQAAGGGTVILPVGIFKTLAPITIPPLISIEGAGTFSIWRPNGVNGMNFQASDSIGPRRFAKFWLYGNGADNKTAIYADIADPQKIQGIVFEDVYISFFGTGVRGRGFWHTDFNRVVINQVFRGMDFPDRSVKVTLENCKITRGGLITGSGDAIGVYVGDANATFPFRPEDLQISKSIIFGFDTAVYWRTALFGAVRDSDLDGNTKTGISIVTADDGFIFEGNYIEVNHSSNPVYGIDLVPLGYTPQSGSNISIRNNRVGSGVNAPNGSAGIRVGSGQANITLDNNGVKGKLTNSLMVSGAKSVSIQNNRLVGALSVSYSDAVFVGWNTVGAGLTLDQNTNLSVTKNWGAYSPVISGRIVVPAGQPNGISKSFSELGLPNLPFGTYTEPHVSLNNPTTGLSRGTMRAITTATGITIFYETAFGVDAPITFRVELT